MEKEIPRVPFLKKSNTDIEFEVISIRGLYERHARLGLAIDKPHRVEFYLIHFITKGRGAPLIDFTPQSCREGSIVFVSKGQVQAFDVQAGQDGFLILFTEDFLSKSMTHSDILSMYRLYTYHLHEPIIHADETGGVMFENMVREMYWEYLLSNTFAKEEILRSFLKLFLLRVERIQRTLAVKEKNTQWLATFGAFRNLIEGRFTETRNAKDYADMLGISYKHLNAICKSVVRTTAKTCIDQFIILEAKRRLATTDISTKELTYGLGFDEPTNFLKYFKKHTLQSPSQFKRGLTA